MQDTMTFPVGDARVTLLNAGDMGARLADELAVPESVWRAGYEELFDRVGVFPSQSVYIALGAARVLVDANDYRATVTPGSEYALADYTPPPALPAQLASLGVAPEQVTHLVITHAHWDHYAGATTPTADGPAPTYPQAQVLLGAADWEDAETQTALGDPTSLEARTLGALHTRGLLHLVSGREQLAEGIEIVPAPGETPGHQVVRVHSQGETLYVVGDLFHHPIEVEHPDWMVGWADAERMRATRAWFLRDALDERALILAAHVSGGGRIVRAEAGGLRWQTV